MKLIKWFEMKRKKANMTPWEKVDSAASDEVEIEASISDESDEKVRISEISISAISWGASFDDDSETVEEHIEGILMAKTSK